MEANNMNPDQTLDLGPYCLQYRLPKNIGRRKSRQQMSRDMRFPTM